MQPVKKYVDGRKDVAVFIREGLASGQFVAILCEGGEESEEDLGF